MRTLAASCDRWPFAWWGISARPNRLVGCCRWDRHGNRASDRRGGGRDLPARRCDGSTALVDNWAGYTPGRRRLISTAALESTLASREFIDALARDVVRAAEVDPAVRTAYEKTRDPAVAAQAAELFAKAAPAPRDEVLARYRPALSLTGSREHGAELFREQCETCHTNLGFGRHVGPDLSGVAGRPKETLLGDMLDPSRQVAPDFLSYSLVRAMVGAGRHPGQ